MGWLVSRPLATACAISVCVAACSSGSKSGWSPRGLMSQRTHSAAAHNAPKSSLDADMVAAVGGGSSNLPVEVRFALRERPEVGKSAELDLELIPSAPLDRLVASFHAEEGLTVSRGGEPAERERPEPGVPILHPLTVVPQRDGIFYVNATVLADSGRDSIARTFTIPVIAGSGAQ